MAVDQITGNWPVFTSPRNKGEIEAVNLNQKVLLVDDEPKVLSALRRQLRRQFHVFTAVSGCEGLALLEESGPFAVVVSDMRMPGMDGLAFLREVKRRAPGTTRIMLTGNDDQETAMAAVNDGCVFRFHRKPCPKEVLSASIEAGIEAFYAQSEFLEGKAKARRAQQALTDLFTNMSHELKTPLNHIIGFAELLEKVLPEDARHRDYAGHIHESGSNLLDIVNGLLELGATRGGRFELEPTLVPVARLEAACRDFLRSLPAARTIEFETEVAAGLKQLQVDQAAFERILFSLLSNAVKFSEPGGRVTLRIFRNAEGAPVVAISDGGIGIAPEHIDKVMEPFGRAQEGLAAACQGVGTGLPLARALTEQHGGTLRLESLPGVGTTVSVVLPAAPRPADNHAHGGLKLVAGCDVAAADRAGG